MNKEIVACSAGANRKITPAEKAEVKNLGPLKLLPGTWANVHPDHREDNDPFKGPTSTFNGRGWNIIALPFAERGQNRNYRVLMNQYNEMITFKSVDDDIPNRGITAGKPVLNADQEIAALDYEQTITQIAAKDISDSGRKARKPGLPIHHEPGLFLHMRNQNIDGFDIARLATIPHGNAVTALGRSREIPGKEVIPDKTIPNLSAFPEGVSDNIVDAVRRSTGKKSYLLPYNKFTNTPFKGKNPKKFPGFSPANANALLQLGFAGLLPNIASITELPLASDVMEAGVVNTPFIERQADAEVMRSTFWIIKMKGRPQKLLLAYSQLVLLDFFERQDGRPGRIRWPHISINMMEKIPDD